MNDNDLTKVFDTYRPALGPDLEFMGRLEQRLEAVEFIREQQESRCRRNHIGLVAAAVAGCVVGAIATLVSPWIMSACIGIAGMSELMAVVTTWVVAAVLCVASILAVYDMCTTSFKKLEPAPRNVSNF